MPVSQVKSSWPDITPARHSVVDFCCIQTERLRMLTVARSSIVQRG